MSLSQAAQEKHMDKLTNNQLLYLLHAVAYSLEGTVTKGDVKGSLPKEIKKNANQICDELYKQNLLEFPKRGRISVSEQGRKALISNLRITNYKFESNKGPKILNTLLYCLKLTDSQENMSSKVSEEMDFETFVNNFEKLYLQERKQQELRGVVAIRSRDIGQKFVENYPISKSLWDKYFSRLKSNEQIYSVVEKDE
ncbi:MAG: hypothetical protein AAFW70_03385, partial [Cyanobacteria bacterium J06635_10]